MNDVTTHIRASYQQAVDDLETEGWTLVEPGLWESAARTRLARISAGKGEVTVTTWEQHGKPSLSGRRRFLGRATPKGLVIKAIGGDDLPETYFIAVRHQEFVGPLKRMPGFAPVTDEAEIEMVMFHARRAFSSIPDGVLAQWD